MEYLNSFKRSIKQELNQNDILQRNLLVSILSSRRLLTDHLDILEEAVGDCSKDYENASEKLTLIKTTGVVVTSYAAFACARSSYNYLIPCVTSAIPLLYICKQNNIRKRFGLENTLKNLIKAFDEFETGVKKTIAFINDAQVMEVYARVLKRYDRKNLIPFHLVDTIKRVIRAVYCFTKYMEYYYKLDSKLSYLYSDIDDVDNCELMRLYKEEWDIKTIKDFFSLFAYVQSYALLRLGLIISSNIDEGKHLLKMKVNDMTGKIKVQNARIPSFLEIVHNMQRFHDDIDEKLKQEMSKMIPKELRMISNDALDISINALSFALHAHDLHNVIVLFSREHDQASKKSIDDLLSRLESMGSQIHGCSDEIGRLTIAIKRYLKKEDEKFPADNLSEVMTPKEVFKLIKEDDIQPQKDDFFYVNPAVTENEIKEDSMTEENMEEEDLLIQHTKKCFKPVLQQLKQRIIPIGENFKEREKKVLKEKGIEIADEPIEKQNSTIEMGSDDEQERERKIARNRSKYDASRELLISKEPFNIFADMKRQPPRTMPIPIVDKLHLGLPEDILED